MEQVSKAELIDLIETGHADLYLGTFTINGETRAFYRSYRHAANDPGGFKIVYIVV